MDAAQGIAEVEELAERLHLVPALTFAIVTVPRSRIQSG